MERIIAITPAHILDPQIAIGACRAGELGILDLAAGQRSGGIDAAVEKTARFVGSNGRWGIRWDVRESNLVSMAESISFVSNKLEVLLLAGVRTDHFHDVLSTAARVANQVFLEVHSSREVLAAQAAGFAGCVVKGCEAGGWVGPKSSFILLQELHQGVSIPYWIQGGVGLHTAAAAKLAGAAGIVLCEQLWLTREGPFAVANAAWRSVDGSETVLVGDDEASFRLFSRSGRDKLRELDKESATQGEWMQSLARSLRQVDHDPLVPAGQDIGLAPRLAREFGTTGRVIAGFRRAMDDHLETARSEHPLALESGLARAHGTRYPIVQGPMTRVSDVVPFAEAVAEAGGLPFFALAVMRGPAVRELLLEASEKMRDVPWGVGILGFVPLALRQEQLEIIREVEPPFAIIAGGRPSQARELEAVGVTTYLHVPSPGLLKQFLKDGARKFIFEGSECGGHIGPRTSFVLWNLVVDTLLDAGIADPSEVQVLFAGGIHDALSGAMLSCVASPLAKEGMKVGVLMGSGYLFTQEAVASGAIVQQYQSQAIECDHTAVLRSSIGYATRCADTPFCNEFNDIRRQLLLEGKSNDEITETLERLNIGRLRIASKGVMRAPDQGPPTLGERYMDADQGLQVSQGLYMLGDVATLRSATSTITQLHEGVSKGSERLLEKNPVSTPARTTSRDRRTTDIAIVGMACMFPGAANARALWENILNRVDAVSEVTEDRWPSQEFFDLDRTARDKIYSKAGGFLQDIRFDPTRYGIPPASLRSIEPIQLIALEVAKLALEDAGFDHLPFPRERTAVIFAAGGMPDLACDYVFRTQLMRYLPTVEGVTEETRQHIIDLLCQQLPEWTEDSFPGILGNVVAGRIANRLNLRGSNYTVDAACAASLAALSSGLDQLTSGDADVALVGAADGMNNAVSFMSFAKTQALSPQGRCRPFSNTADGIALSEGVAALVLKRLADAERDGDEIYGLVKAVGSSSDGRNRSLTAPHPGGQIECLRRSYEKAGLAPSTVELLEAHGTGTAVGDKAEIESLATAFGESQAKRQRCAVGSVKSMIGHTKLAAGFAGVIKGVLALKHHVLPPTIGVETPNSRVDLGQTPFYINTETRPWLDSHEGHPRRCGVSAFGFGGANFHAVLEEYTGRYRVTEDTDFNPRNAEIFAWSREHPSEIIHEAKRLLETPHLEALDLAEVAYSVHLEERANPFPGVQRSSRLAVVATSLTDLKRKLESVVRDLTDHAAIDDPNGIYFGKDAAPRGSVCFLFPGQGSQRINMLRDLVVSMRALQCVFEDADAALRNDLSQPLSQYIYPLPVFSNEKRKRQAAELNATQVAQPALGVAGLAAFDTLGLFGLHPDFLAGHSYGEYVALCAAGVISREQLIRLSSIRGHIAAKASETDRGAMAAVQANADTTAKLVDDIGLSVSLASLNAPDQTIIGGSVDAVSRAVTALAERRITASQIPVAAAFHTQAMSGAAEALAGELAKIAFRSPTTTVFSNTLAAPFPEDAHTIRKVLARHIVEPLRFTEQIESLYQAGARVFIEAGPGKVLSGLVDRILGDMPHASLSIDSPGTPGWLQLAHLLSCALVLGLPVEIDTWFRGRRLSRRNAGQLAKEAYRRGEPGPTVWRVNPSRAVPWRAASTLQPVSQVPAGGPQRRHEMSKHDGQASSVRPQAVAETTDSGALVSELQRNLSQLIELQKEQQRSMQGLLEMQQQLISAALRGGVAKSVGQATRETDRSLAPDASTTSEPNIPKVPQVAVLPPLKVEPKVPVMTAGEPWATPAPATARADRPNVPDREPTTMDGDGVPSTDAFKSVLLRSVSERTGYPEEC